MRVIRSHNGGFFSNFNKVMAWLHHDPSERYYVEWQASPNFKYGPNGINLWPLFFDQLSEYENDKLYLDRWPNKLLTFYAIKPYYTELKHRQELHAIFRQFIKVKPYILNEFEEEKARLPKGRRVALHIRADNTADEQPNKLPISNKSIRTVRRLLRRESGTAVVFTDNLPALAACKRWFKHMHYTDVARSPVKAIGPHESDEIKADLSLAKQVLIDAMLMAECDHLVHGVSNVASAALFMNPELEHTWIR